MEYQPDQRSLRNVGGTIRSIVSGSIAADLGLQPGDALLAVDGQPLRDIIDYRFATAEGRFDLLVQRAHAPGEGGDPTERIIYEIEKDPDEDLGIEFTEPLFDRLRTCNNKCPFCFLTQLPKGLRKTLYLKDDDYRLSFLYSNFVTLTNLSEEDWQRIEQQHLSPLSISVHATDRALRAVLLGKPDVPDVLAQIARLAAAGIDVHTQIVACPGLNDGAALDRTITDLAACYPTVQSISVVPVGLTRFRFQGKAPQTVRAAIEVHDAPEWQQAQPAPAPTNPPASAAPHAHDWGFCSRLGVAIDVPLRCYTPQEAERLLDQVHPYSEHYRRTIGLGLVYPSDEFYLISDRPLPPAAAYDDSPQYSNGVGMVRDLLDTWASARRRLPARLAPPQRLALVCGTLIAPVLQQLVDRLNQIDGLDAWLLPVVNQFFGATVTVSGLLTGQDVVPALRASAPTHAVLPRVMFDYQALRTLDEYSPQRIASEAGVALAVVDDAAELVQYIGQQAQKRRRGAPIPTIFPDRSHQRSVAAVPAEAPGAASL